MHFLRKTKTATTHEGLSVRLQNREPCCVSCSAVTDAHKRAPHSPPASGCWGDQPAAHPQAVSHWGHLPLGALRCVCFLPFETHLEACGPFCVFTGSDLGPEPPRVATLALTFAAAPLSAPHVQPPVPPQGPYGTVSAV